MTKRRWIANPPAPGSAFERALDRGPALTAEQVARLREPYVDSVTIDGVSWWLQAVQPIRRTDMPGIVGDRVTPYDLSHELVVLKPIASHVAWGFVRPVGAPPAPVELERLLLRTTMEGDRIVKVWMLQRDW